MEGARSILLSITGGSDISLWEVNEAAKAVAEAAHPDANIIFGAMVDEKIENDQVWITVVATGYDDRTPRRRKLVEPAGEPRVSRVERASDHRRVPSARRGRRGDGRPGVHAARLSRSEAEIGRGTNPAGLVPQNQLSAAPRILRL